MTTTDTSDLDFQIEKASVWGSGITQGFDFSLPTQYTEYNSGNVSDTAGFGDISVDASGSVSAGLDGTLAATLGSFSLNYPIEVNASVPGSVNDSNTFSINTSNYSVQDASVDLIGPGVAAELSLFLNAGVSLSTGSFFNGSLSFSYGKTLSPISPISFAGITIAAPSPFVVDGTQQSVTDALTAVSVQGEGAPFLEAEVDLADLAAEALELPPPSGSFDAAGIDIGYTLLAVDLAASVALGQEVTFTPTSVNVTMSYGTQTASGQLGHTFNFTAPSSGSGVAVVTATYTLTGQISTRTGVEGDLGLDISALGISGNASIGPFAVGGTVGPLINYDTPTWTTGLGAYNSLTTSPFTVSAAYTTTYLIPYGTSSVSNLADPVLNLPTIYLNVRVGDGISTGVAITNDGPSGGQDLKATVGSVSGPITAHGSIGSLSPGATDNTDISVGLPTTASPGPENGTVTLQFSSSSGPTSLPSQTLEVFGNVYREAEWSVSSFPDYFMVHVGDKVSQPILVSNTAPNDGYSEDLLASVISTTGNVSAVGTTGDIAPQSTSKAVTVGFSTTNAGSISGQLNLNLQTDGTGIDGAGPTGLVGVAVPIAATVNNYADPTFSELSKTGTFSLGTKGYALNIGTYQQYQGSVTVYLGFGNNAPAPSDLLSGNFVIGGASEFSTNGFVAFQGLGPGDQYISINGAPIPSVTLSTNVAGTFAETIAMDPVSYNASGFSEALATQTLTVTGTVAPEDVSCFTQGTLIETENGAVAVEALRAGDRLRLEDGEIAPVVWIGHRTVDCRRHPDPRSVWPVRIKAGAFACGMPKRTLTLSPDHAVYVNEVLVPVKHLVNGTTIRQVKAVRVTYYHVELPRHEVILAEEMPVESYLDVGDRANFDNAGSVVRMHIDLADRWEAGGCAPLVIYGPELDAAKKMVAVQEGVSLRQRRRAAS